MSVAGGLPFAIARAHIHRCETLQVFTKNASQWRARPLPPEEIAAYRRAADETGIGPIVAHASYLINLATVNPALRHKSGSIERSTMNARFASKNGRNGSGSRSIAREAMNLCASNPHALAVDGTSRIAVSTPSATERIPYYR